MRIRREALEHDPSAFSASPEDDVGLRADFVRQSLSRADQATFGAFNPDLIGLVGVSRDRQLKASHKAHLWGLYVSAAHRRLGIGRLLVEAALRFARELNGVNQVHLSVSGSSAAAIPLYGQLGFNTWGTERDGLRIGARLVTVHHMVLTLGEGAACTTISNRDLIRRFYEELWNPFDKAKIPELLTDDVKFRGSLGRETFGHSGFAAYMDTIQAAFPDFTNQVEEIISANDRAFARLTYRGTHRGTVFGIPPTSRHVEYAGAAVFRLRAEKIAEVWVLGDVYGLLQQLRGTPD
jgi:steroid delta-isomerase-like uncharacterized protein